MHPLPCQSHGPDCFAVQNMVSSTSLGIHSFHEIVMNLILLLCIAFSENSSLSCIAVALFVGAAMNCGGS